MDQDTNNDESQEAEPLRPQVVEEESDDDGTLITEPSKVIRIASMTRAMLDGAARRGGAPAAFADL